MKMLILGVTGILASVLVADRATGPGNVSGSSFPLPVPSPTVSEERGTPGPTLDIPPYVINELRRETIHNLLKGEDQDGDGVSDADDNCARVRNPDQRDRNRNGIGDACEIRHRRH